MSEVTNETKTSKLKNILKTYFKKIFFINLFILGLILTFSIILKDEFKNLLKFSKEKQLKLKNSKEDLSPYDYHTLLILNLFVSFFAIDRFYIGNIYAPVKLILNLILFIPTFGIFPAIWNLVDFIKILNCSLLDKDGKRVCYKNK